MPVVDRPAPASPGRRRRTSTRRWPPGRSSARTSCARPGTPSRPRTCAGCSSSPPRASTAPPRARTARTSWTTTCSPGARGAARRARGRRAADEGRAGRRAGRRRHPGPRAARWGTSRCTPSSRASSRAGRGAGARHTHVLLDDRLRGVRERRPADPLAELRAPLRHEPRARHGAGLRLVVGRDPHRRPGGLERVRPALAARARRAARPGTPRRTRGPPPRPAVAAGAARSSSGCSTRARSPSRTSAASPPGRRAERARRAGDPARRRHRRHLAADARPRRGHGRGDLLGDLGPRGARALEAEAARLGASWGWRRGS